VASLAVIVRRELASVLRKWRSPSGTIRFRYSSSIDRTNCSACALQFGAPAAVRITRHPPL
jgi:hypothetical protein